MFSQADPTDQRQQSIKNCCIEKFKNFEKNDFLILQRFAEMFSVNK
jgi:hypothetical protein